MGERAYRRGITLSWGMVMAAVDLYPAIEKDDTALTSVCTGVDTEHAPTKLHQKRWCEECSAEVPYTSIKKAKPVGDGFIVVEAEEIAATKAPLEAMKKQMTLTLHPAEGLMLLPGGGSTYECRPNNDLSLKGYAALHALVSDPAVVALGQFVPSSRASTYRLMAYGDALIMQPTVDPTQIKVESDRMLPELSLAEKQMMQMAASTMAVPFDPETYQDRYALALRELLESKQAEPGLAPVATAAAPTPAGGVDLMAALAAMTANTPAPKAARTRKAKTA